MSDAQPVAMRAALDEALGRLPPEGRHRVEELTRYHAPTADQAARLEAVNAAARLMLAVILDATPGCADQSAAVRLVREAKATANAAIVCGGLS